MTTIYRSRIRLVIVNKSTLLKDSDVRSAAEACRAQIRLHVAPAWALVPANVAYHHANSRIPPGADQLVIMDDADQAGALGYHRVDPKGNPYGRVFVRPILNHGGTPLTGQMSVSASISHEVCEWLIDPLVTSWVDGPEGEYPLEICDPVEDDSYRLADISVSNFVTRHYFNALAPAGSRFDHLRRLEKPFSISPGGYLLSRTFGEVKQVFGDRYQSWRLSGKNFPAARTYRRRVRHG